MQIRQDELAALVENKYDNLWKGIEKSLENISTVELRKYHEDVQAVSGKIEKNMNMRISYCLDILAKTTETNRQKDLKKAVILRFGFPFLSNGKLETGSAQSYGGCQHTLARTKKTFSQLP